MTAEAKLRTWGCHWRARLDGSPVERLGFTHTEPEMKPGDVLKEIEILKERFPRMDFDQAREAVKYAPMPRTAPMTPRTPGMADLEREVSLAIQTTGDNLWETCKSEAGGVVAPLKVCEKLLVGHTPDGTVYGSTVMVRQDMRLSDHQGRLMARLGVRYLVRQVYVIGTGVRRWPGSSFDWIYPYAIVERARKSDGREATLNLVKSWI